MNGKVQTSYKIDGAMIFDDCTVEVLEGPS